MKKGKLRVIGLLSIALLMLQSCGSDCTVDNLDIIGGWDVTEVDVNFIDIDKEEKNKSLAQVYKHLEDAEFYFRENGELFVDHNSKFAMDKTIQYKYEEGANEISFGGLNLEITVEDCDMITLLEQMPDIGITIEYHCKRIK